MGILAPIEINMLSTEVDLPNTFILADPGQVGERGARKYIQKGPSQGCIFKNQIQLVNENHI